MYKIVTLLLASLLIAWGGTSAHAAQVTCPPNTVGNGVCLGIIDFTLGTPLPNEDHIFLNAATNTTSFTGQVGSQSGLPQAQFTTDVAVDVATDSST